MQNGFVLMEGRSMYRAESALGAHCVVIVQYCSILLSSYGSRTHAFSICSAGVLHYNIKTLLKALWIC